MKTSQEYKNLRFKMESYINNIDKLFKSRQKTMNDILIVINKFSNNIEKDDLIKIYNKMIEKRFILVNKL
jgi:aspartate carbamoyltransferase regulatory subunit|tara:strand:- start:899 stop:1108 length:210 start_codon:yes stop_codon:yes gene_type:complete